MAVIARCTGMGGIRAEDPGAPAPVGTYLMGYDFSGAVGQVMWTPDKWDALVFADLDKATATCQGLPHLAVLDMTYETGPPYRPVSNGLFWRIEDTTTGDLYPVPGDPGEPGDEGRLVVLRMAWQLNRDFIDQGGLS